LSALEVTFPDEWLPLPLGSVPGEATSQPTLGRHPCGDAAQPPIGVRGAGLLPVVDELDFADGASLALLGERCGFGIRAFCAVGVVPDRTGDVDALRRVAEHGRHPGLERDTVTVQLCTGRGVRSAAFRFAPELLDDEFLVPFAAEVRFALPLPAGRIGVLHFETVSLARFEELECLFDTIAGTARIS
jgi:hypothetical protein